MSLMLMLFLILRKGMLPDNLPGLSSLCVRVSLEGLMLASFVLFLSRVWDRERQKNDWCALETIRTF